ncbi:hypothetical protein MKY96_23995 [Paenibacillus sp. FSL R7-0302]|uniref:hypothetical protein n=1 Tax=Paenibacillus sp. FSL R7-0302 TaxID=2921681 RepID=UPI0030F52E36
MKWLMGAAFLIFRAGSAWALPDYMGEPFTFEQDQRGHLGGRSANGTLLQSLLSPDFIYFPNR